MQGVQPLRLLTGGARQVPLLRRVFRQVEQLEGGAVAAVVQGPGAVGDAGGLTGDALGGGSRAAAVTTTGRSGIASPRTVGSRLVPFTPAGSGSPASSSMVGIRSTDCARNPERRPAAAFPAAPGSRIISAAWLTWS